MKQKEKRCGGGFQGGNSNKSRPYLCLLTEYRRVEVQLECGAKGEERGRNKGEEGEESVAKQQSSIEGEG